MEPDNARSPTGSEWSEDEYESDSIVVHWHAFCMCVQNMNTGFQLVTFHSTGMDGIAKLPQSSSSKVILVTGQLDSV